MWNCISTHYQYAQMFVALKQNDYVKKIILGLSKTGMAISSLKYFMITIIMVILLTFIMTGQIELLYIGLASFNGFNDVNNNEFQKII